MQAGIQSLQKKSAPHGPDQTRSIFGDLGPFAGPRIDEPEFRRWPKLHLRESNSSPRRMNEPIPAGEVAPVPLPGTFKKVPGWQGLHCPEPARSRQRTRTFQTRPYIIPVDRQFHAGHSMRIHHRFSPHGYSSHAAREQRHDLGPPTWNKLFQQLICCHFSLFFLIVEVPDVPRAIHETTRIRHIRQRSDLPGASALPSESPCENTRVRHTLPDGRARKKMPKKRGPVHPQLPGPCSFFTNQGPKSWLTPGRVTPTGPTS